jgi:hypothetical protein
MGVVAAASRIVSRAPQALPVCLLVFMVSSPSDLMTASGGSTGESSRKDRRESLQASREEHAGEDHSGLSGLQNFALEALKQL